MAVYSRKISARLKALAESKGLTVTPIRYRAHGMFAGWGFDILCGGRTVAAFEPVSYSNGDRWVCKGATDAKIFTECYYKSQFAIIRELAAYTPPAYRFAIGSRVSWSWGKSAVYTVAAHTVSDGKPRYSITAPGGALQVNIAESELQAL